MTCFWLPSSNSTKYLELDAWNSASCVPTQPKIWSSTKHLQTFKARVDRLVAQNPAWQHSPFSGYVVQHCCLYKQRVCTTTSWCHFCAQPAYTSQNPSECRWPRTFPILHWLTKKTCSVRLPWKRLPNFTGLTMLPMPSVCLCNKRSWRPEVPQMSGHGTLQATPFVYDNKDDHDTDDNDDSSSDNNKWHRETHQQVLYKFCTLHCPTLL